MTDTAEARSSARVGFLGTGIMGAPMARRLDAAGFPTTVWNRDPSRARETGLAVADTAAECAAQADIVLCMLSSGPVCDAVLLGEGGVLGAMQFGSALVVMSSIPVPTARRQAEEASRYGIDYVDAPVSGGERSAREGTLAIMAGGEPDVIERLAPVLAPLGRVTRVGGAGTGSLAKLANQTIVASTICAVAEAFLLAERGGADPARLREALLGGFADSTVLNIHGRRMIDGDFALGGSVRNQRKDTATALEEARGLGLDLPLLRAADAIFAGLMEHDGAELDHSAAILELRRLASAAQIR